MTREDIIGWMQEVGAKKGHAIPKTYDGFVDIFQHFAALVAAAEREACAEMVDHILKEGGGTWGKAIRSRGEVQP